MRYEVKASSTPLAFKILFQWEEPISNGLRAGVWNLFEIWANVNDVHPEGKVLGAPYSMTVEVGTERRLGPPKNRHPLE